MGYKRVYKPGKTYKVKTSSGKTITRRMPGRYVRVKTSSSSRSKSSNGSSGSNKTSIKQKYIERAKKGESFTNRELLNAGLSMSDIVDIGKAEITHIESKKKSSNGSSGSNKTNSLEIKKDIFGNPILQTQIPQKNKPKIENKKISGTIGPASKTNLWGEVRKYITPSKKDSKVIRGLKGVGSFFADLGEGTVEGAKTTSQLFLGDEKARKKVEKNLKALTKKETWDKLGLNLGRMVQSSDPYLQTQGMLTLASVVSGPKIPINRKINIIGGETKYKVVNNLNGKTHINLHTKGITDLNENIKTNAKLVQDSKKGDISGTIEININGKKHKQKINLKNKAGYFEDTKNKIKIPKSTKIPDKIKLDIKEIKTRQPTKDTLIIDGKGTYKKGSRTVTSTRIQQELKKKKQTKSNKVIFDKTTKITTKETSIDYINNLQQKGKKIKPFLDILGTFERKTKTGKTILTSKASKTKKTLILDFKKTIKEKGLSDKKLKEFLKDINYDKELINGLDRRTRLARALGLRKNSKKLKAFEMYIQDGIGIKIERKGKIVSTGKEKIKGKASYSAGLGLISKGKKIKKTELNKLIKIDKEITIPEIKLKIKQLKKIRGLGIIAASKIDKIIEKLNKKLEKENSNSKQKPKKDNKPKTKQKPKSKEKTKDKSKNKTPQKSKNKSKNKENTKIPSKPKSPLKPKIKIKRKPKIPIIANLELNSKLPNGQKLAFDILYREKGKVKSLGVKLPLNKALNKATNLIDKTTAASMELKIVGITKQKDTTKPKNISKFRIRKTKKALKLVEKRNRRIDTKGEKKGLSVAKLLAKGKKNKK